MLFGNNRDNWFKEDFGEILYTEIEKLNEEKRKRLVYDLIGVIGGEFALLIDFEKSDKLNILNCFNEAEKQLNV